MVGVDPRDFDHALEGLDFPTSRDAVLRTAADKGGINGNVLVVLEQIPDQTYETREQLQAAISEAYIDDSGMAHGMPVTAPDDAVADKAATAADTQAPSAA